MCDCGLQEDALADLKRHPAYSRFSSPSTASPSSSASPTALSVLRARFQYWLGLNHLETDELSTGERQMQAALATLTPLAASHPTAVIDGHNQLAVLYTQRAHYNRAIAHLTTAQKTFQAIKHFLSAATSSPPSALCYTVGQRRVIQRLHTMTLYYLAQTYAKVDKRTLSAYYCHICLNRQLNAAEQNDDSDSTSDGDKERLDGREWVVNAMGLSVWYEEQLDWESAWHCVKAAESVLARVREGEDENEKERRRELAGEVDKTLACFYLRFLQHTPPITPADSTSDSSLPFSSSTTPSTPVTLQKPIRFTVLSLPPLPCSHPLTLQTALPLFNAAYRHFQSALSAFPLDGYVTEHCQLLLDVAALYRSLIPYDAVHEAVYVKRAVSVLSRGLDGLSAHHFVDLYREMSEEAGNCYMALMDAKTTDTPSNSNKRNEYGMKAIHHYQLFASSFQQTKQSVSGEEGGKQTAVERGDMYKYLLVQFTVARLYQRLWTENVTSLCTFHRKSLEVLQRIIRLCGEWQCGELFASELAMCVEMTELLPRKMDRMRRDGAAFQV